MRSFARIHDTNLKKQGLLPLTFCDPATYDIIGEADIVSVLGLSSLAPETPVECRVRKPDGSCLEFECPHPSVPIRSSGSERGAHSMSPRSAVVRRRRSLDELSIGVNVEP